MIFYSKPLLKWKGLDLKMHIDYGLCVTDMDWNWLCCFIKGEDKWKIDVNGDTVFVPISVNTGVMWKGVLMPINHNFHAVTQWSYEQCCIMLESS